MFLGLITVLDQVSLFVCSEFVRALCWICLICCTENTIHVDTSAPEKHREFLLVPFQEHPSSRILYNGLGVEVTGADFENYWKGCYQAWLESSNEMVLQLPTACSTFVTQPGIESYQAQRHRIGGHSDTYEVSRMVVRNQIIGHEVTSFIQTYQFSHLVREHTSLCEHGPNTCSHLHGNGNGPKHSSHPRMSD